MDGAALKKQVGSDELGQAIAAAIAWLDREQAPDGYWAGYAETNVAMEAEWLLTSHFLGQPVPHEDKVIAGILNRQRADGAWEVYPNAPKGDLNGTVEAYAALRAKGFAPDHPALAKARDWIRAEGGLRNIRVFTRYWLAMIGVWPWDAAPNLPPEVIRLPYWIPFNIYHFAQWARATIVPLCVVSARQPVWPLPGNDKLEELFPEGRANFDFYLPNKIAKKFSLEWAFEQLDKGLHWVQRKNLMPGRENAVKLCLEWLIKHQDWDGAWGGIQPPWIYGVIALFNEGYDLKHPIMQKAWGALDSHWAIERDDGRFIQATDSVVWDTMITLLAQAEAGRDIVQTPSTAKALEWLLDAQVLVDGDWSQHTKNTAPGGWAFERGNIRYPDVDDTAVCVLMLATIRDKAGALRPRIDKAIDRAVQWLLGMQCDNGGWGAFDKDNNKEIISKIPFCNFGEALDPPSADVTAHVIEALAKLGMGKKHPAVARALAFLRKEQEPDGSWFGRWGVNYIYGTGAVLPALRAAGEDMAQPWVQKAADWLKAHQNADGGWGESCASYMNPAWRGKGESTPSQTAWALLALMAHDETAHSSAVLRGLGHLTTTQRQDGSWNEPYYTGTGFPGYGAGSRQNLDSPDFAANMAQGEELSRGFMIGYNMYRHYFPLMALGRARAGSH
jgi:squalene-hopene/tetraprenyl-beta-curcumene cyclase